MKKLVISICLLIVWALSQAQQRVSLYEEFTSENYGAWFPTNPNLNTLLLANSTLIIPIKWQVPIPTAPNNPSSLYQTNRAEINFRYRSSSGTTVAAAPSTTGYGYPSQNTATDVATNGINSGLTGRIDGQHQWAFGANSDHPADLTSVVITSAQTQSTNFRISMTTSWSPTFTNCVVGVSVTSTSPFTALGPLMFPLCLVEREITFATPPGINGEKKFYDVVRKSYPTTLVNNSVTSMGTALPGVWISGQVFSFTISCNIPNYIKDLSQMAFVGFVQDDGDRKIYQAMRTSQPAIPNDIDLVSINIPQTCSALFNPSVVVQNLGPVAVTALTITPYVDGVLKPTFNYGSSIAAGATETIALTSYTTVYGAHTFSATITGVSGVDINLVNNTSRAVFGVSNILTTGVTQTFSSVFPPSNWYVLNYDFEPATWGVGTVGAYGTSSRSAKFDFYNVLGWGNEFDDLYLPALNLTGISNVTLYFDVAYAQYTNQNDVLDVLTSTDCGVTWVNVYSKQGSVLSTAPSNSISPFVPNATQWRTETINLPALANQPNLLVKFRATSDFGNNLYLDNVNIGQPPPPPPPTPTVDITNIGENRKSDFLIDIFPNPTSDVANLSITFEENVIADIKVMNSVGQLVYVSENKPLEAGHNLIIIDSETFASGVYFINVVTPRATIYKKLNIIK